jgi:hypothetical protein
MKSNILIFAFALSIIANATVSANLLNVTKNIVAANAAYNETIEQAMANANEIITNELYPCNANMTAEKAYCTAINWVSKNYGRNIAAEVIKRNDLMRLDLDMINSSVYCQTDPLFF